jgi:hypothetical protein
MLNEFFSIYLILSVALSPSVIDSASNRNEYQEFSLEGEGRGVKAHLAHETDNLTTICVYKCGNLNISQPYSPLQIACYRDSS